MPDGQGAAKRLRVMTLVDGFGARGGGGERLAAEIAKRLDPDRFERLLCVTRWSADRNTGANRVAVDKLRRSGVVFMGLNRSSPAAIWAWRPLAALIRQGAVDVVHAHKFGSNLWAAIVATVARPPVLIAHEHSWSYEGRPLRKLADRCVIAPRVDAFIAVSREDRRRMIELEGISPEKIRFIPNGIAAMDGERAGDVRAELGIDPGDPVVGAVGSLRAEKAYDVLLRAAAILLPSVPRLRVVVAGEGDERPRLDALTRKLGLDQAVTLLGYRPDVPAVLGAFDIAVCCSEFEGSPLSLMEYMEAAKPVVATHVGGVPDLIADGVHGLLVRPSDPVALAGAIDELIRHPDEAAEMGARGRARRREEFDIDATVHKVESLYEELWSTAALRSRRDDS